MNYYGDTSVTDLIGQGLTDATLLAQNQQNKAALANSSWFEQQIITGVPNWLLLGGGLLAVGGAYVVLSKKKSRR